MVKPGMGVLSSEILIRTRRYGEWKRSGLC